MSDQPSFGLIKDLQGGQKVVVALHAGSLEHGTLKDGSVRRTPYDAGAAFLLTEGRIVAGPVDARDLKTFAEALLANDRRSTDRSNWLALAAAVIAFSHA